MLGKYIAFHNYRATVSAVHEGHPNFTTEGGKPTSSYIPRFKNVYKQETNFLRGYAAGFGASRIRETKTDGFGDELLNNLLSTKKMACGELVLTWWGKQFQKNQIYLDKQNKDPWGLHS